jgi:hypothetical protein
MTINDNDENNRQIIQRELATVVRLEIFKIGPRRDVYNAPLASNKAPPGALGRGALP